MYLNCNFEIRISISSCFKWTWIGFKKISMKSFHFHTYPVIIKLRVATNRILDRNQMPYWNASLDFRYQQKLTFWKKILWHFCTMQLLKMNQHQQPHYIFYKSYSRFLHVSNFTDGKSFVIFQRIWKWYQSSLAAIIQKQVQGGDHSLSRHEINQ